MKKIVLSLGILCSISYSFALPVKPGEHFRIPIKNQFIIKASPSLIQNTIIKNLGSGYFLVNGIEKQINSAYEKVYPNYEYFGNYLDENPSIPNDTYFSKQIHHQQISTLAAWETTQGDSSIVIAVTDNEFQLDHRDLSSSWWKNPNEIPNNKIDDDQNGYIDDVYGWDFIAGDNNVDSYDDPTHGTHVSGIISALENNSYGGIGIAPKVKVMPLRWFGQERNWTSAVIAETYQYAIDNGANIISTSYNIDLLVEDNLYLDVVKEARKKGILIFNSAGNSDQLDPPRQSIEDIILVCSVTSSESSKDYKSSFSNYGTGIDICAPGDPIFSTVQIQYGTQDRYASFSGTSMATPVVAAVAALIWAANPNFSDLEVREKLFNSSDNIERKNLKYKGLLGHGRVNAYEAVK